MKKIVSILTYCFLFQIAIAQNSTVNYWITFKDKAGSGYSIDRPSAFLSSKAIERRKKQNIMITVQDLPVNQHYVSQLSSLGVKVIARSKWFNAVSVTNVSESALKQISNLSFVKSIRKIEVGGTSLILDKKFQDEEAMAGSVSSASYKVGGNVFSYGLGYIQANQIGAVCLHNQGYAGQGMVIAVLDAGFYKADSLPAFDSLRTNNQILGCRDFVTGDTLVYEDYPHGMNVLSCMGGNIPGSLVGTAPKAKYWLLRTEDAWSESLQEEINWTVGVEFADSVGADVINSSLGYSTFDNAADNHTYADMDGNTTIITKAADIAASKGIFVTTSAGNAGGPPWYKITAPADADSVLTVGAVDSLGIVTGFSSRGPTFDGRIKPNVAARGRDAAFASPWGGITQGNGTSFSSPITAGAVACLWQAHPTKTNMELLAAIEQSASQASSPDTLIGYGIPNFCTASNILSDINEATLSEQNIIVYPNPFSTSFMISFYSSKKQKMTFSLIDITGRSIYTENKIADSNVQVNMLLSIPSSLSTGIYFLQINSEEQTKTIKLIKE